MLNKRVLVLHVAWGEFCIDPCGKALVTTPRNTGLVTPLHPMLLLLVLLIDGSSVTTYLRRTVIVPSALDTVLETMHRLFKGVRYHSTDTCASKRLHLIPFFFAN